MKDGERNAPGKLEETASLVRQWRTRPRIHPTIFLNHYHDWVFEQPVDAQANGHPTALIESLGWTPEKVHEFARLIEEYGQQRKDDLYLNLRFLYPEVEIEVSQFGGRTDDLWYQQYLELSRIGLIPTVDGLEGNPQAIDKLCLQLLSHLNRREAIDTHQPGGITERRGALPDSTLNVLICLMLDGLEASEDAITPPSSLLLLIRRQLKVGPEPELYQAAVERSRRDNIAYKLGKLKVSGQPFEVRQLARACGVPRSTLSRWLRSEEFQKRIDWFAGMSRRHNEST